MSNPLDVAHRFVEAINRHDLSALAALMAADHRFVDSLGELHRGRDEVSDGWHRYFQMVPDYRIEIRESFASGPVAVLLGQAEGTYTRDATLTSADRWSTPAAWRVHVEDGQVIEWRIYADNEPIRERMRTRSA